MTDKDFQESIIDAKEDYKNDVPYSPLPPEGKGNSNSLIGSVLRAAGSAHKPTRKVPGWDKEVIKKKK